MIKRLVILFLFIVGVVLFCNSFCLAKIEYATFDYNCFSVKSKDKLRWQASALIDKSSGGANVYKIYEEAKGFYSSYDGQITRKTEVFYESTPENNYKILKTQLQFFDKDDKLILSENQIYDYDKKKVFIKSEDFIKNKTKTGEVDIKGIMVVKLTLTLHIMDFLKNGEFKPLYFVSSRPAVYKIDPKVIKEEEIKWLDKKIKTYKLQLDPDVGMLNFLKFLFSNTYVWFNRDAPYEWVKFEGLETDLGSERVVVETAKAEIR